MSEPPGTRAADERALRQALRLETDRLGITLSSGQQHQFARYADLLAEWNDRAGLTAISDPASVARRLFGESLALLTALRDAGLLEAGVPSTVADIGTGGGFPSLPMRIAEPALRVYLIESQRRRSDFLETATGALGLEGVRVVNQRAEEAGRDPALRGQLDLVVCRAVAHLSVLVEYALPLLRPGGVLAASKGSRARSELGDAASAIAQLGGSAQGTRPLSLPAGAPPQEVVLVRRTGTVPERYPRRPGLPGRRPLG